MTCVVLLASLAGPSAKAFADRTVSIADGRLWPGKQVLVAGQGWGTAYGICPAGPIRIVIRQSNHDWSLDEVRPTSVAPISGGFSIAVRLPAGLTPDVAYLRLTQGERVYHPPFSCDSAEHDTRAERALDIHRRLPGTPCTPDNGCVPDPQPRLEILQGLPDGASLPPPDPVCPDTGCTRSAVFAQASALPVYRPGGHPFVVGSDFPDTALDNDCRALPGANFVRFLLTDASGTAVRLTVGQGSALATGRHFATALTLPDRGLAPGPAVLTAFTAGFEFDPLCGRPASAPLRIRVPAPALTTDRGLAAGAMVIVRGGWWATDRCDSRIEIVLHNPTGADRVLATLTPGVAGGFTRAITFPRT